MRRNLKSFAAAVLVFGLLLAASSYIFSRAFGSYPKVAKVADVRSNPVRFSLIVPAPTFGPYQFILGAPKGMPPQPMAFQGHLILRQEGKTVLEHPFSSETAEPFNGWVGSDVNGYLLAGATTEARGPRSGMPLRDGQLYDVTVEFTHAPPQDAAIWFRWTARGWNRTRGVSVNGRPIPPDG